VLRLGDLSLVLGQRLGEWVGHSPALEEDLGLANIALDLIGQARLLLGYAGEIEGRGRDEDKLAFLREQGEYFNPILAEQPNGDFGRTIVRQVLIDAFQLELYEWLTASSDGQLAEIAAKAVKETKYHVDHAVLWTLRLGDGTSESHRRMQAGLDDVWPFTHELFEPVVPGISLRAAWLAVVEPVLRSATLRRPLDGWAPTGGRQGIHTEAFSYLVMELQVVHRAYPGGRW